MTRPPVTLGPPTSPPATEGVFSVLAAHPALHLKGREVGSLGDGKKDLAPVPGIRSMGVLQVAVVSRQPSDSDEVTGHVEPTLATELDVMQRGRFDVTPAYTTAALITLDHEGPDARWHQAKAFEFQL